MSVMFVASLNPCSSQKAISRDTSRGAHNLYAYMRQADSLTADRLTDGQRNAMHAQAREQRTMKTEWPGARAGTPYAAPCLEVLDPILADDIMWRTRPRCANKRRSLPSASSTTRSPPAAASTRTSHIIMVAIQVRKHQAMRCARPVLPYHGASLEDRVLGAAVAQGFGIAVRPRRRPVARRFPVEDAGSTWRRCGW
jgi:hypothetical protein